jgi:hypothetical protein
MSEQRPSSQRKTLSELAGVRRLKEAMANGYVPRERVMTNQEYRDGITKGLDMNTIARNVEVLKQKELAGKPPFGGKKTHTYKNKEYVVRTGEKGGRFILVGGKEKKKVYI